MSFLLRTTDLIYTFRFLKLLVTPFEKTSAFEFGIIDKNGIRNKDVKITDEMRFSYTPFHKLVFNIKKIMAKLPGGSSTLASYVAALYLIKENYGIDVNKALKEAKLTISHLQENNSQWFLDASGMLVPGTYKVLHPKVLNDTGDELVKSGDKVRVSDKPVGDMFGVDVYEATHINTNKKIYVTSGELSR